MSVKTNELKKRLKEDKELAEKISGINNPDDILALVKENGFDVTMEDLLEVEQELRKDRAQKTDEKVLEVDELNAVAGGFVIDTRPELAPDRHEMGCNISYHHRGWSEDNNIFCKRNYYCTNRLYD